jgi:hypothetical protein
MREEQFDKFVDDHPALEHRLDDDEKSILLCDPTWPFYQKDGNLTKITKEKFAVMTPDELESAVYGGVQLEHITRVTGYMTKVSGWNKGKMAELRDRSKCDDNFKTRAGSSSKAP